MLNAIEFDGSVFRAFENDVNLGVFLMVMVTSIPVNLSEMDSSGKLWSVGEGPPGDAARARHAGKGGQVDDGGLG